MLEFSAVLALLFLPPVLGCPARCCCRSFAGLWMLWQTQTLPFGMTATASTWLPHEIIWTFILPLYPLAAAPCWRRCC